MSTNAGRKRCCKCLTVLTSEDKHRFGVNCEICEEDTWYYEHFDYVPFNTIWRYARYQLRWLWNVAGHLGSLLLRGVRRILGRNRSEWTDGCGR
jgi:hypothetical protein